MDDETIISLRHVSKEFDGTTVVDDFNLEVRRGEFITILGPSGCGKTTTLRMIAGFELPSSGQILLNGEDISLLPPNKRPVNTVFQHYALFPHLKNSTGRPSSISRATPSSTKTASRRSR